jgi:hypothetical protein
VRLQRYEIENVKERVRERCMVKRKWEWNDVCEWVFERVRESEREWERVRESEREW